jgi:hypothetical protein
LLPTDFQGSLGLERGKKANWMSGGVRSSKSEEG